MRRCLELLKPEEIDKFSWYFHSGVFVPDYRVEHVNIGSLEHQEEKPEPDQQNLDENPTESVPTSPILEPLPDDQFFDVSIPEGAEKIFDLDEQQVVDEPGGIEQGDVIEEKSTVDENPSK